MKIELTKTDQNRIAQGRQAQLRGIFRPFFACFWTMVVATLFLPHRGLGETLLRDPKAPSMTNVQDVLAGDRTLYKIDDAMLLNIGNSQPSTSVITLDTQNSQLQPQGNGPSLGPVTNYAPGSIPGATASGRMYNESGDVVLTVTAFTRIWALNLWDPATGSKQNSFVQSNLEPNGSAVFSRIVMGNFRGDGLSEALVFVESAFNGYELWGMNILYPSNVNTVDSALTQGPQLSGCAGCNGGPSTLPYFGSIAAGDFNGDGRDEIAALMSDYQTIQFYSVDPNSFAITPTTSLKLPNPIGLIYATNGNLVYSPQSAGSNATLAAGRFRNTSNVELAAIGQVQGSDAITIYSIQTMQQQGNTYVFNPTVAQTNTIPSEYYAQGTPLNGVLVQAAPILNWSQATSQQLVLGLQYDPPRLYSTGFVWIGTFDSDFTFHLDDSDDDVAENGCLVGMQVGNFDNQNSGGTRNGALQVALFENVGSGGALCQPNYDGGYLWLKIMNIDVPSNLDPLNPPQPPTGEWLEQASSTEPVFPAGYDAIQSVSLVTGDLQNRSLLLGPPDIVRIPAQYQVNVALGIPPMHVDYITPPDSSDCQDTTVTSGPCIFNLSVQPSAPATTTTPFATQFTFTSSSNNNSQSKTTTSWGLSTKETTEAKLSFNDLEESASADIKDVSESKYSGTVSTLYNTYQQYSDALNVTTGLADVLLFSEQDMNIYYYPVIGKTDSNGKPVYVEFSVPDNISYFDLDATKQEWYQPAQEPGNIFSYPWSESQLQGEYGNALNLLTTQPTCQATDTSGATFSTTWTEQKQTGTTTGNTNFFSNELSVSASEGAGVSGVDGVSFSTGFDITDSSSLSTLNETLVTLNASDGIVATKPKFFNLTNSSYNFAGYIFGESQPANQVWDTTTPQADLVGTGPMYTGFIADPVPNNPGGSCGGSGGSNWWGQAYNQPDIGFNHPARWTWNSKNSTVSFNMAQPNDPLVSEFYWMKGFFVTKNGNSLTGHNLSNAILGDQLTLTARVFNFSLADTPSNASVHVLFYGQYYCAAAGEPSCNSATGTCAAPSLCGKAFEIGEAQLAAIPGFKSASTNGQSPNWSMASITFDTGATTYPNLLGAHLVFWVVTWLQDSSGNLIAEVPGHGLTGIPDPSSIAQIGDVPIETYSNNVGMYEVHNNGFFIAPPSAPGGTEAVPSEIKNIALSADRQVRLGQNSTITARFDVGGGPASSVRIAYFDGDPNHGGQLIDHQTIHHVNADSSFYHRTLAQMNSCGPHTIVAEAFTRDNPIATSSPLTVDVTLDPVEWLQGMITYLEKVKLPRVDGCALRFKLELSEDFFGRHHEKRGIALLDDFVNEAEGISKMSEPQVTDQLTRLIGQAKTITGCEASR